MILCLVILAGLGLSTTLQLNPATPLSHKATMAPKRILATTELQGRGPGTKFDGAADVEGIEQLTISRIVVHYHTCVNALTVSRRATKLIEQD